MNNKKCCSGNVYENGRLTQQCGQALKQTSIYLKFLKLECNHVSFLICAFTGELNFRGSGFDICEINSNLLIQKQRKKL